MIIKDNKKYGVETKLMKSNDLEKLLNHTLEEINCPDVVVDNIREMFSNQSVLKTVNIKTPNSVSSYGFYYSFNKCSSLHTVTDFSNIKNVGSSGFFCCFRDCSNLTTAPDFSNVTSVSSSAFSQCFMYCRNLTTAPDFRNITSVGSGAFSQCFNGCSNLTTAYAPTVANWSTTDFNSWLGGVAPTGTLYADYTMEGKIPTNSVSGCPSGWTIVYTGISNATITSYPQTTVKSYQTSATIDNIVLEVTTEEGAVKELVVSKTFTFDENTGNEPRTLDLSFEQFGFTLTLQITQTENDEKPIQTIDVTKPDDVKYGFELNEDGYWESTNKENESSGSFSYAVVNFTAVSDSLILECINDGETNYDYGTISNLGQELLKVVADMDSTYKTNFNKKGSSEVKQVVFSGLTIGERYMFTVKYKKDYETSVGRDSLQFRVKQ